VKFIILKLRFLSELVYPIRIWLLVLSVVAFMILNIFNLSKGTYQYELLLLFSTWFFALWSLTFGFGHRAKNKYEKVQLFKLPFALSSVMLLVLLIPISFGSIAKIYGQVIGS